MINYLWSFIYTNVSPFIPPFPSLPKTVEEVRFTPVWYGYLTSLGTSRTWNKLFRVWIVSGTTRLRYYLPWVQVVWRASCHDASCIGFDLPQHWLPCLVNDTLALVPLSDQRYIFSQTKKDCRQRLQPTSCLWYNSSLLQVVLGTWVVQLGLLQIGNRLRGQSIWR